MNQPALDLDAIETRANAYARGHAHLGALCGPACEMAAATPALAAEVRRLRAELAATQANALLFAADRLEAVCPDGVAELRLALCQCDAAHDLRTLAADQPAARPAAG